MNFKKIFEILTRLDRASIKPWDCCEKEVFIRRVWKLYLPKITTGFRVVEKYPTGGYKFVGDDYEPEVQIAIRYRYLYFVWMKYYLGYGDSLEFSFIDITSPYAIQYVRLDWNAVKALQWEEVSNEKWLEIMNLFLPVESTLHFQGSTKTLPHVQTKEILVH